MLNKPIAPPAEGGDADNARLSEPPTVVAPIMLIIKVWLRDGAASD